jgi:hypothetical protein
MSSLLLSINPLVLVLTGCGTSSSYLNGFRKNFTLNLEQIPPKRSDGYAFSGICPLCMDAPVSREAGCRKRPTFFAKFPLIPVPFVKHAA